MVIVTRDFRFVLIVLFCIVIAIYYFGLYLSHADTRVRSDIASIGSKCVCCCCSSGGGGGGVGGGGGDDDDDDVCGVCVHATVIRPALTPPPPPPPFRYRLNRDSILKEKAY